ncbi:MAG: SsrA-binding protein SmpB [Chloroflexi bacterium]|nr:MAG: SsrA-binding protein SmpB [Chloroflexota bacterium]
MPPLLLFRLVSIAMPARRTRPPADADAPTEKREVSLRAGRANLRDGYARVENGEVYLRNVHIAPWPNSPYDNHDPLRPRKLLLHKDEIARLVGTVAQKGYTLVPLRMYVKSGRAKVELGVARGRKRYDKRQVIKEREATREMDVAIRRRVGRG